MNKKILLSLVLPLSMAAVPMISQANVSISINIAPPVLPVYAQPVCPGDGYIWTPGYWAWDGVGYYWVPGTWVLAPRPGYLWTPGWWGWNDGLYVWHAGYWGPHVGFYGGVNYGYGYGGRGYEGGRWDGERFYYNRTVNNVNVTNIHNTYNTTVVNNVTVNRVSFNGGNGGVQAQPTAPEREVEREAHLTPTADQTHHEDVARSNPALSAANNHGHPAIAATPRPGAFDDRGVVPAKAAHAQPHAGPSPADNRGAADNEGRGGNGPQGHGGHRDNPAAVNPGAPPSSHQRPPSPQGGEFHGDARPQHEPGFQSRPPQPRPPQPQERGPGGPGGPRPEGPHGEGPHGPPQHGGGEHEHEHR